MTERFAPAAHVAWVDDGKRVAMVRLDDLGAEAVALEDSAADVWRALGDGASLEDVVSEVAAMFGVDRDVVRSDVAAFLDDASRSGIVTRYDA